MYFDAVLCCSMDLKKRPIAFHCIFVKWKHGLSFSEKVTGAELEQH